MIDQVSVRRAASRSRAMPISSTFWGDAIAQDTCNEGVNEFAERAMIERERLRVEVRLAPMKRVFPNEPQRIAEKAMEGCRGLNFGEGIDNKRVVGHGPARHERCAAHCPTMRASRHDWRALGGPCRRRSDGHRDDRSR